jgi:multicomponent Na+:H+ antiporter subunit D
VSVLPALPLLLPLASAALSFVLWRRWLQRALAVLAMATLLAVSSLLLVRVWQEGVQVYRLGDWPAPFGIVLAVDTFSAVMLVVAAIIGLAVAVYSLGSMDDRREAFGYYPFLHLLLMGVCGAFLTGDVFNLFVWFEVMLMASFVLMALGGERAQMEGAIKYFVLNLLSSLLLLAAIGILYGLAGTLNMADLALKLQEARRPGLVTTVAMLFLVALGIKAALFPLFFWLPASYHTPPPAVSAVFAGLLTKVGVYALVRVFTLLFVQDVAFTHNLILALSGATMVVGVLGAVAQEEFRRILSFQVVAQIGYVGMGLGIFTPLSLAGAVFYALHDMVDNAGLFMVSGIAQRLLGSHGPTAGGGLYRSRPGLGLLFLLPALSLAGLPPLSGFFGKLALVRGGLEAEQYAMAGLALAVSLLGLLSLMKVWLRAFWQEDGERGVTEHRLDTPGPAMVLPAAALAALTLAMGLGAGPLFALATRAAEQLMDPSQYIEAVLGR